MIEIENRLEVVWDIGRKGDLGREGGVAVKGKQQGSLR